LGRQEDEYVNQGRSDGGGISVYIPPPNQSTLNFLCGCFVHMWDINICFELFWNCID